MELSEVDSRILQEALGSSAWQNEQAKCEPDIKIEGDAKTLYYHTECRTFAEGKRSLSIGEDKKRK